jgi:hypothetical protein
MTETASPDTLTASDYLAAPLEVGEPDVCGGLAVYPIWGPRPVQHYISFRQGRESGVVIKELDDGASVNDLLVINDTENAVLLFEGEEVLGAQQNRTFDITALIAACSHHRIPVSCVEAGRWEGRRRAEAFKPSPQTANAELRRRKAMMVQKSLDAGGPARADQAAVWKEVDDRLIWLDANSPTRALNDAYESRRDQLRRFNDAIRLHDGQSGALVAIGGSIAVLDWVSRPEAFGSLHPALLQGYALDAIDLDETDPPSLGEAKAFIEIAMSISATERDGIGLGREVRFAANQLIGTGLAARQELVQLTVHQRSSADGNP